MGAGTHDDRPAAVLLATGLHDKAAGLAADAFHSITAVRHRQTFQMRGKQVRQLIALDPFGIAGIVLQGLGLQDLSPGCHLLKKDDGTAGTDEIQRRRHPGRATAYDCSIEGTHARALVCRMLTMASLLTAPVT